MNARKITFWALANYIVLAFAGVLLRYLQLYALPGFSYQFLLHSHSHFAFSAWMFLSLAFLIVKACNDEKLSRSFKPVVTLTLISSFGMLVSFAMQGYKPVSITFSTLFIFVTYGFTYIVLKNKSYRKLNPVSRSFLKAALFFLCLSSLGPYTLAPLAANGLKDTQYYQNAIYFYLHFQMNGWMLFGALTLIAHRFNLQVPEYGLYKKWLLLFIGSTGPLYFIFTLWAKPSAFFAGIALFSSLFNLAGWLSIFFIFFRQRKNVFLLNAALIAITLKVLFQVLICFPAIGEWTFNNRNLIIGYIHLIALGCISPVILQGLTESSPVISSRTGLFGKKFFIASVVALLVLLFVQPLLSLFGIWIPGYMFLLLGVSVVLLVAGVVFVVGLV